MNSENVGYAIETWSLGRHFSRKEAVRNLSLQVPEGSVFALIGPNGAGKTTTIKMLMNIIEPSEGRAQVLGKDSRRLGPPELSQIGYVSENQTLPEWMSVRHFLAYCRPMYPSWDDGFSQKLIEQFDLPLDRKLRDLSRGMKVQAALVSSLAYRPALLILDEPFSGLDPVVRDDLIRGVLELAGYARWTIFLSSQDIEEVERLADWVAFLDQGQLYFAESVSSLQSRFRQIEVLLGDGEPSPRDLPASWMRFEMSGRTVRFLESSYGDQTIEQVKHLFAGCRDITAHAVSLRELFIAVARARRPRAQGGDL
ncbi:MAG: ABC transporter ATP-binding protein [Acidobacteria bacterium]|nr:MAG: ABC transporter ATP-binding protein [Acidobacteriota bacterium]